MFDAVRYGSSGVEIATGLFALRAGVDGWDFETTVDHSAAVRRHSALLEEFERTGHELPPGARLLICLVINDQILTLPDLKAATSAMASLYSEGDKVYIEFARSDGYRDRRWISAESLRALDLNGGCAVSVRDFRLAAEWLRGYAPNLDRKGTWPRFVMDASAWWSDRLAHPAYLHVSRLRQLQLLPRSVLARRYSKRPQLAASEPVQGEVTDRALLLLQCTRARTDKKGTVEELLAAIRGTATRRISKAEARDVIVQEADRLLAAASLEGRAQVAVLLGTRHVVENGGLRGGLLAPSSMTEYTRKALPGLVDALHETDLLAMTADEWLSCYRELVKGVSAKKQRGKLAAFLEVFHRFMVVAGAEPLLESIGGGARRAPPWAAAISPDELELAVSFIWTSKCSDEIRRQAELGLRLAYQICLRIEELWCIRVGDINPTETGFVLSIAPRQRDGIGKSPALRRQEDVSEEALVRVLTLQWRQRLSETAGTEEVLLGEPGIQDGRHEEEITTSLMNEALRWASGCVDSSFHDLRHTRASFMSEDLFAGTSVDLDAGAAQQVAASVGHAGLGSTAAYQHLIEVALARQSQAYRASAWTTAEAVPAWIESVEHGLVESQPRVAGLRHFDPARTVSDLSLARRIRVMQWILETPSLKDAAAGARISLDSAHSVLEQTSTTLQRARILSHHEIPSTRELLKVLRSQFHSWAQASTRAKHAGLIRRIDSDARAGKWTEIWSLWNAWSGCQDGEHFDLTNAPAAAEFVNYVLLAGVPKDSMLVVSHASAVALSPHLTRLAIETREEVDRGGRAMHRLQFAEPGVIAAEASGSTLTMRGMHWVMFQVGAMLMAQRAV